MNPGTGGYKTRDHMSACLVILEHVRVVSRDALLLGKGLDLLLLRNHNRHQEALQQQQQQADSMQMTTTVITEAGLDRITAIPEN